MATATPTDIGMKYRFLGNSGLLVSTFGFGCMAQDDKDVDAAFDVMAHAFKHGVNFWDTAEAYGCGAGERGVGRVLQRGIDEKVWTREDLVITAKIFFGTKQSVFELPTASLPAPNASGLGRKHLIEGTKASLQRMGIEYADVIFCHRPEKFTPKEEIVRAMNFIIDQGWAFYWGTSEWQEADILEACEVADRLGLIRPIVEQSRYNLFYRSKVEVEFQALYSKYKLGLTTFSPLAYGVLTGKYAKGTPEGSRFTKGINRQHLEAQVGDVDAIIAKTELLRPIAAELGCTLAQLALAWAASNENVSTVLLGATTVAQLDENLKAFPFVSKITPEIKARMEQIAPFEYKSPTRDQFYSKRAEYM